MKSQQFIIPAVFCMLAGCSIVTCNNPHRVSLEENKRVVRRSQDELWSQGRFDVISELYTDDFVCHFVIGPEWRGPEGLLAEVRSHRSSFPDWREDIQKLVAEGDYVVSYFKSSGTHLGEFHGLAATGRIVQIEEVAICRLEDGRIAEQWGLPDIYGMYVQLGIVEQGAPADADRRAAELER